MITILKWYAVFVLLAVVAGLLLYLFFIGIIVIIEKLTGRPL